MCVRDEKELKIHEPIISNLKVLPVEENESFLVNRNLMDRFRLHNGRRSLDGNHKGHSNGSEGSNF